MKVTLTDLKFVGIKGRATGRRRTEGTGLRCTLNVIGCCSITGCLACRDKETGKMMFQTPSSTWGYGARKGFKKPVTLDPTLQTQLCDLCEKAYGKHIIYEVKDDSKGVPVEMIDPYIPTHVDISL